MHQTNGTSFNRSNLDQLRDQHGLLEARLRQLDRHRSLSPEEQYEMQVIKKRKLHLKDQITQMEAT